MVGGCPREPVRGPISTSHGAFRVRWAYAKRGLGASRLSWGPRGPHGVSMRPYLPDSHNPKIPLDSGASDSANVEDITGKFALKYT